MTTTNTADIKLFQNQLVNYKQLIDKDIDEYVRYIKSSTLQNYGAEARLSTDVFCDILQRGGKRIRGALVMQAYQMAGGKDQAMILQAARAIEMFHAYLLIIDDIQDRSAVRRGGPTAHVQLADYHRKKHLEGDSDHFGVSVALNAALSGSHGAGTILANLNVDPELRSNVLSITNRTMLVTSHGQTLDIINEVSDQVSKQDIDRVEDWKTAQYTFLNPLHVGMVLAGQDCHATDAITVYAHQAGRAFQITDDILGTFGTEFDSGKSPLDDLREGKQTLLTVHALKQADKPDQHFLMSMLGNQKLTQAEFDRCKSILVESGALDYAQSEAVTCIEQALDSLKGGEKYWSTEGITFLKGLAEYLLTRTA